MSKLSRFVAKATFKKRVYKTELHPAQGTSGHLRSGKPYLRPVTSVLTPSDTSITSSSSFSTPSFMTTEQQTSTTVSLTTATTQAPVTTVSSNTPVSGSEISLGGDTMPSNSPSHAHASEALSGFLVPVSATDQEPSGDASLQTNSTNVLGAQSSAFSLPNLLLPAPDIPVTAEQLQAVRLWLQQATANFNQRLNVGRCISQPESVSQTTRHDIPTSQIDTTAHLAQTSVQSRATLFSPHYSALNSATTTNTPLSHVPLPY